jgi:glycosyltransferase involved in cell wall biosynthesis
VCVVIRQFFDEHGENMFCGGAERYLIELERLLRDLGYHPEVYQSGAGHWVRSYNGLRVVGLDTGGNQARLNRVFHTEVPPGALTIYLEFSLAAPYCHPNSIGVSHGIYWDDEHALAGALEREMLAFTVIEALEHASTVVSVDTSTINWVRGTQAGLAQKFIYIPNFVDTQEFRPSPESGSRERLVVLFPRRLNRARGFWLLCDVLPELVWQFPGVDFHLVGKGGPREEAEARSFVRRYSGQVRWYVLPPERMSEAYSAADIAIIPTVWSEGTSLSCLEAQASGNAVIATTVGGLSDLVLHDFNGLLIEPTAAQLRNALVSLITDRELRSRLSRQATAVAQTFSLDRWRRSWTEVLRSHCPAPGPPSRQIAVASGQNPPTASNPRAGSSARAARASLRP